MNQVQLLLKLAKKLKKESRNKEDILETLRNAKIITKNSKFTWHPHYKNLGNHIDKIS